MKNLGILKDSKTFYEDRYKRGYMEQWPKDKKNRVLEVFRSLSLPKEGEALDFGCGNGIFTAILKKALPHWKIYGCDLSQIAVKNAKNRYQDCIFFFNDDVLFKNKKFDFIFSHHVIEHVFDVEKAAKTISEKLKPESSMLHILPCGNEGSFEYMLCSFREDGINKKVGNRFFFEDEGHIRRMATDDCISLFAAHGFKLKSAFYSNQYHGAINWITRSHPLLILKMFNPLKGRHMFAKLHLVYWLIVCVLISALRLPYIIYERFDNILLKIILYLPSRASRYIDKHMIKKSEKEWKELKNRPNGSEMYLYFKK